MTDLTLPSDDVDRRILESATRDEQVSFEALFADHRAKLIRVAERIVGWVDAEDVVQETFIRAWRHAARFDRTRGTAAAWLTAIASNTALDFTRRRQAAKCQPVPDATAGPAEPKPVRSDACHQLLRAGIALLPAAERAVIELAYFEGLSHSKVAAATNLPLGTVKTRLRSGLSQLRLAVPASAFEIPLIDRAKMERDRISGWLGERVLRHVADMYFVDWLKSGGRIHRTHWGHVDPRTHECLEEIWRFAPGIAHPRHPVRVSVEEKLPQVVTRTSNAWQQQVAISAPHLLFMRTLRLSSLLCQPLLRNGRVLGALTLIRTVDSDHHYTAHEVGEAYDIAAELTNRLSGTFRGGQ